MVAALGCFTDEGQVVLEPAEKELVGCTSVHAMAYDLHGDLLLDESAGAFDVERWEQMAKALREKTMGAMATTGGDESMSNGVDESTPWLRHALEESVRKAGAWREGG
jgi:exosome complex component RRP46